MTRKKVGFSKSSLGQFGQMGRQPMLEKGSIGIAYAAYAAPAPLPAQKTATGGSHFSNYYFHQKQFSYSYPSIPAHWFRDIFLGDSGSLGLLSWQRALFHVH